MKTNFNGNRRGSNRRFQSSPGRGVNRSFRGGFNNKPRGGSYSQQVYQTISQSEKLYQRWTI